MNDHHKKTASHFTYPTLSMPSLYLEIKVLTLECHGLA